MKTRPEKTETQGFHCPKCKTDWTLPAEDGTCPQCHDVYIGGLYYRIRNASFLEVVGFCTICYLFYRVFRWLL
jgi:hypothetical protein